MRVFLVLLVSLLAVSSTLLVPAGLLLLAHGRLGITGRPFDHREGSDVWARSYGGNGTDVASSVIQTLDGGYFVTGRFADRAWVFKLGSSGNVQWQETLKVSVSYLTDLDHYDIGTGTVQLRNGSYMVAGYSGFHDRFGCCTSWIVNLDKDGGISWAKSTGYGVTTSIDATRDGGVIISGYGIGYEGEKDTAWLARLDAAGNNVWNGAYYIPYLEDSHIDSVHETSTGGFVATGVILGLPWVFVTHNDGTIQWQKTYNVTGTISSAGPVLEIVPGDNGQNHDDHGNLSLQQDEPTRQTGYIVLVAMGSTYSTLAMGLDAQGQLLWGKAYESISRANALIRYGRGDISIAEENGILTISSSNGNVLWHRTYTGLPPNTLGCIGGQCQDSLHSIARTRDSGFILAGYTGAQPPYGLDGQAWVLKTDSRGNCCEQTTQSVTTSTSHVIVKVARTDARSGIVTGGRSLSTDATSAPTRATVTSQCASDASK